MRPFLLAAQSFHVLPGLLMNDATWCIGLNSGRFLHQLDNVVIELFTPILLSLATIKGSDFGRHGFHPILPSRCKNKITAKREKHV